MVGAVLHAGQVCMGTERVVVFEGVRGEFEGLLGQAVEEFGGGEKGGMCLVGEAGVLRNKGLVEDAVRKEARVLCGGVGGAEGTRMVPTVLTDVTKTMDIYYTESFGPTVSVMFVKSEEEALELANDTEYGLSAAVFTRDLGRALRMARGVESGAVHVNGMTVHDETALPHGGKSPTFSAGAGNEADLFDLRVLYLLRDGSDAD